MKRVVVLLALGIIFIAGSAGASRPETAAKLLELMNMQETIEQSFSAAKQMLPAQMKQMQQQMGKTGSNKNIEINAEKIMDLFSSELSWEKLRGDYIALYSEVFTEQELQGLVDFYGSPAGQAFVKKQPELTKRTMMITNGLMMKIMPKMQQIIKEQMKKAKESSQ